MKLYDDSSRSNVLESNLAGGVSNFNIARTPHMFHILSSGLYSDKIAAVLREIGCNAADAHIMAGKPELPFEVKLPSTLDRTFYIKDWGPGLDDDEVRNLYTVYGLSTKQDSDTTTGAFGLGSKSPYAYTLENRESSSGFTVTAVKHGVQRTYSCYLDDEGVPSIALLHECEASKDWPSGVQVSFAVQMDDIHSFADSSAEIFRWFTVKPRVLGMSRELLKTPAGMMEAAEFSLYTEGVHNAKVLMGNVLYPVEISADSLFEKEPNRDIKVALREILTRGNVVFKAPIGSVLMTPSREALQDVPRTRKYIESATRNVLQALQQSIRDVQKEYENSRFGFMRHMENWVFRNNAFSVDLLNAVLQSLGMGFRVGPQRIPLYVPDIDKLSENMELVLYRKNPRRVSILRVNLEETKRREDMATTQCVVYVNDDKCAVTRARERVRESNEEVLLVSYNSKEAKARGLSKDAQLQAVQNYVKELVRTGDFEGAPVRNVSELELVEVQRKPRQPRQSRGTVVKKTRQGPTLRQFVLGKMGGPQEFVRSSDVQLVAWFPVSKETLFFDPKADALNDFIYGKEQCFSVLRSLYTVCREMAPGTTIFCASRAEDYVKAVEMGATSWGAWLRETYAQYLETYPAGGMQEALKEVFPLLESLRDLAGGEFEETVLQAHPDSIACWWYGMTGETKDEFFEAMEHLAVATFRRREKDRCLPWETEAKLIEFLVKKVPLSQLRLELNATLRKTQALKQVVSTCLEESGLLEPMTPAFLKKILDCCVT